MTVISRRLRTYPWRVETKELERIQSVVKRYPAALNIAAGYQGAVWMERCTREIESKRFEIREEKEVKYAFWEGTTWV
jgi:hypothetical protein